MGVMSVRVANIDYAGERDGGVKLRHETADDAEGCGVKTLEEYLALCVHRRHRDVARGERSFWTRRSCRPVKCTHFLCVLSKPTPGDATCYSSGNDVV